MAPVLQAVQRRESAGSTDGKFPFAVVSDVGRVRDRNEDAVEFAPDKGVFILADGMGGHPAGNLASRLAVEVAMHYATAKSVPGRPRARKMRLACAIMAANEAILDFARREEGGEEGMGTTLAAIWIGAKHIDVSHVGDSRVYRLREKRVQPLTHDHTVVRDLIEQGEIAPDSPEIKRIGHILTQAVGLDSDVHPDFDRFSHRRGDTYLLCSDGLSDLVTPEHMLDIVQTADGDLARAAETLVDAALEAGGTDNITVMLVRPR